jgi:hypothetical protein
MIPPMPKLVAINRAIVDHTHSKQFLRKIVAVGDCSIQRQNSH